MTSHPTLYLTDKLLNIDVLWRIFSANTDMFESQEPHFEVDEKNKGDRPLNTLRQTAQVCRYWRDIIMSSPALWGRVIDLDVLQWKSRVQWRKEVLARAGQASLHIFGTLRMDLEDSREFLWELLDQRWSSIQKFTVSIAGELPDGIDPGFWRPLQRPSPLLHTFRLLFQAENARHASIFSKLDLPLFSDSAPALRAFAIRQSPTLQFSLQAPWLHQLRDLEIFHEVPCFHATEFIRNLSSMPYLEQLTIVNGLMEPPFNATHSANVSLKFLARLMFIGSFRTATFLLAHITPTSACSVSLIAGAPSPRNSTSSDIEIQTMCKALSCYTEGCLVEAQRRAGSFFLYLLPTNITIIASVDYGMDPKFLIRFDVHNVCPASLVSGLLSAFLRQGRQRYLRVKSFLFSANRALDLEQLDMLGRFFSFLVSVTELHLSCSFRTVLEVQDIHPDIFPNLQTLNLQQMDPGATIVRDTLRFLSARVDSGRPIGTLKLPALPPRNFLQRLDVISGLQVIWGDSNSDSDSYICGVGNAEPGE